MVERVKVTVKQLRERDFKCPYCGYNDSRGSADTPWTKPVPEDRIVQVECRSCPKPFDLEIVGPLI